MTGAFFKKSISFYATLFALWAVFLLAKYHGHRYEDSPLPSAGLEQSAGDGTNAAALQARVSALRQELTTAATNARKSFVSAGDWVRLCQLVQRHRECFIPRLRSKYHA